MMFRLSLLLLLNFSIAICVFGQTYIVDVKRESALSDKLTGGVLTSKFVAGEADIKVTINIPAFKMTLWQNGRFIKSYPIGVGLLEYPVAIGPRRATSIEWNPVWIPPSSDWIEKSSTVKPGEVILPTDPRNPLGKLKIPLGYGYLIHQAKGPADMGSLVSHGCIRVMQRDLYDLAEKIVTARGLDISPSQIVRAKRTNKTLIAPLEPALTVEITYDTMVVENGVLHVYPDVYKHKGNTVENLRTELRTSGVDDSRITDAELKKMIAAATGKRKFVIKVEDLKAGNLVGSGRTIAVLSEPPA